VKYEANTSSIGQWGKGLKPCDLKCSEDKLNGLGVAIPNKILTLGFDFIQ
jgi:hypothetical protein